MENKNLKEALMFRHSCPICSESIKLERFSMVCDTCADYIVINNNNVHITISDGDDQEIIISLSENKFLKGTPTEIYFDYQCKEHYTLCIKVSPTVEKSFIPELFFEDFYITKSNKTWQVTTSVNGSSVMEVSDKQNINYVDFPVQVQDVLSAQNLINRYESLKPIFS